VPVASARPDQNPTEIASQPGPGGPWPTGARWRGGGCAWLFVCEPVLGPARRPAPVRAFFFFFWRAGVWVLAVACYWNGAGEFRFCSSTARGELGILWVEPRQALARRRVASRRVAPTRPHKRHAARSAQFRMASCEPIATRSARSNEREAAQRDPAAESEERGGAPRDATREAVRRPPRRASGRRRGRRRASGRRRGAAPPPRAEAPPRRAPRRVSRRIV
jgi:hypothetical protein